VLRAARGKHLLRGRTRVRPSFVGALNTVIEKAVGSTPARRSSLAQTGNSAVGLEPAVRTREPRTVENPTFTFSSISPILGTVRNRSEPDLRALSLVYLRLGDDE
jgi:hypothetical protein